MVCLAIYRGRGGHASVGICKPAQPEGRKRSKLADGSGGGVSVGAGDRHSSLWVGLRAS